MEACQFIAATLDLFDHFGVSLGMPHESFCKGLIVTATLANAIGTYWDSMFLPHECQFFAVEWNVILTDFVQM